LNKKAEFLAKFHEKCPYCERPFRKKKYSVNSKIIMKWLDSCFMLKNS